MILTMIRTTTTAAWSPAPTSWTTSWTSARTPWPPSSRWSRSRRWTCSPFQSRLLQSSQDLLSAVPHSHKSQTDSCFLTLCSSILLTSLWLEGLEATLLDGKFAASTKTDRNASWKWRAKIQTALSFARRTPWKEPSSSLVARALRKWSASQKDVLTTV